MLLCLRQRMSHPPRERFLCVTMAAYGKLRGC